MEQSVIMEHREGYHCRPGRSCDLCPRAATGVYWFHTHSGINERQLCSDCAASMAKSCDVETREAGQ